MNCPNCGEEMNLKHEDRYFEGDYPIGRWDEYFYYECPKCKEQIEIEKDEFYERSE